MFALRPHPTRLAVAALLALTLPLAACGSEKSSDQSKASSTPAATAGSATAPQGCPTAPVDVVVSVDQWGDIVSQLGGACTTVKTVIASSSIDPHDYEPSPSDASTFAGAKLVVLNGADYDHWASDLAATSAASAPVVSAAEVTKTPDGANPHLWYNPTAVTAVADAVTAELSKIDPEAADYFKGKRSEFTTSLQPYETLIGKIKAAASGKSYAATEGIFDYQAAAMGLVNKTPEGYQKASANESDPTPADIEALRNALAKHQVDVLIYNTQTEGSIPEQIRTAAEQAGVPVVNVTETVPPGVTSFVTWQDDQLTALAKALGVAV
ncbi:metal ABC transporter solute-binding protein, Zn/Mn family [Mycolicibacterium sp. CH28]|uniref:metal ABC transporter solute-binding protein, Zn/Mn family n=1 Tax=Mycolicibacterium sp. CH28 TaxID=2512237 RepID=UPI001F191DC9|nr:zinc ABC transporter substrate-binding protein [Mycolicibacterium sp. CH28]